MATRMGIEPMIQVRQTCVITASLTSHSLERHIGNAPISFGWKPNIITFILMPLVIVLVQEEGIEPIFPPIMSRLHIPLCFPCVCKMVGFHRIELCL